jgi:hypothetical protein
MMRATKAPPAAELTTATVAAAARNCCQRIFHDPIACSPHLIDAGFGEVFSS